MDYVCGCIAREPYGKNFDQFDKSFVLDSRQLLKIYVIESISLLEKYYID